MIEFPLMALKVLDNSTFKRIRSPLELDKAVFRSAPFNKKELFLPAKFSEQQLRISPVSSTKKYK